MRNIDFISQWLNNLKAEIETLPFQENDVRKDFFGMLFSCVNVFYLGYMQFDFSDFIKNGIITFDNSKTDYDIHKNRLSEIYKHPYLRDEYNNFLNRSLFIDVWSNFELCVTTLCKALSNVEETDKLLNYQYYDLIKIFKNSQISEEDKEKLKKNFFKENFTHIPVIRKTDFLFKKAKNYSRIIKEDKEFLVFWGKLRNTMHTNFIYYGKNYEYRFGHARFVFENGKEVKWEDPFEPSPKLFLYMITQLKEVWKALINSIDYEDIILYPDIEQR